MAGKVPDLQVSDYAKFFGAGALCCTITHGAVTPIDVVKTRIQIDPSLKGYNMIAAGRQIVSSDGPKGLLRGFGPTAVGYLVQGGAKFAGYEYWKKRLVEMSGGIEAATAHRTGIYLAGAAIAEVFADALLAPLEATRIRLVSDRQFASGLMTGFARLAREEGLSGLYAGYIPLLAKQVPFALGQFTVNEWMHELVYGRMSAETKKNMGAVTQNAITLGCGLTAGVAAAVLSQPGDTLLSRINKGGGGKGSTLTKLTRLAAEAGPAGLFSGLGPRIVMTAGLVAGQFWLYASFKRLFNAGEGVEIHKSD